MMTFPNFRGYKGENASNFLDDLEMALLASRRDEDEVKIRAFSLVLREGAKTWFQGLAADKKGDWETLKETFLEKYVTDRTPEKLWLNLTHMHQDLEGTYSMYKTRF